MSQQMFTLTRHIDGVTAPTLDPLPPRMTNIVRFSWLPNQVAHGSLSEVFKKNGDGDNGRRVRVHYCAASRWPRRHVTCCRAAVQHAEVCPVDPGAHWRRRAAPHSLPRNDWMRHKFDFKPRKYKITHKTAACAGSDIEGHAHSDIAKQ